MGILARFSSIIKANINDLLDKAEDPTKMIDQYLREMSEDLAEVKKETASVIAEETRTKRLLDDKTAEVSRYTDLAKKAIAAGNDEDARVFLTQKQKLEEEEAKLVSTYAIAKENATKIRQLHDKLVNDINELKSRSATIKAKAAVAKTQGQINSYSSSSRKAESARAAFDRMEEKADRMLDTENAMAELNETPTDPAEKLAEKYGNGSASSVDEELARMKAEMGL